MLSTPPIVFRAEAAEWREQREEAFTRADFIKALNEDLAREYQAVIAYVVYSQSIKGAQYMTIAEELEEARRARS